MRLSVFNLYVSDCPTRGSTLVHNTFTGAFVTLTDGEIERLRELDGGDTPRPDDEDLLDPAYVDPEVAILVESREAEQEGYRQWFAAQRAATDDMAAIVSVTFACNFACTYCCQEDVLDGRTMSPATARNTATWLAGRAREIGARRLHVDFVGGEPLLHPTRIEEVVRGVNAAHPELAMTFGLITNGLFMVPELVDRWVPLGLRNAKVTLDGDASTHSITRRSKRQGEDTFDTIFRNIIAASKSIRVNVNGNYQGDTVHGFAPLVRQLAEAGLPPGTRVFFSPALATLGAPVEAGSGACTWSESSPALMIALADEVRRGGFDPGDPLTMGPCGFHKHHQYAIDPEGLIYKCPGFLGYPSWAVGDVATADLNPLYRRLVEHDVQEACGTCAHRPNCAGGCVAHEWRHRGAVAGVNCEIDYFTDYQDHLVRRRYALTVADRRDEALAMFPPSPAELPVSRAETPRRSASLRVIR